MIEDERIGLYIHSLDRDLPEKLRTIEKEALEDEVPIIKKSTQGLLRFLVNMKKPQHILEVGCAVGFSAVLMSEAMPEGGHITTIEKVPQRIKKAKENFVFAEKQEAITLLEGDATDILKKLVAEKKTILYDFYGCCKGAVFELF